MTRISSISLKLPALAAVLCLPGLAAAADGPLQFNRDIKPILSENCMACHGADPAARKAGLRLDTEQGFFESTPDRGPTVIPGKPEESPLYQRLITTDQDELRPPPEYPRWRRIWLRLACNVLRLEFLIRGRQLPTVLCPRGGRALLECYVKEKGRPRAERIAKFGFTTEAGAPIPPIQDTVRDLYGRNPDILVRTGAVIYMFVEPQYRKRDVGTLGLEVISLVQACQNLDFCVLVANDKGSGRLISWYERHNFQRAPKLQDAFGSPNAVFGVTMIAPTKKQVPDNCTIQWW